MQRPGRPLLILFLMMAANSSTGDWRTGLNSAYRPSDETTKRSTKRAGNVKISREGHGFRLTATLSLRQSAEEVFGFFADPRNLDTITPRWLRFRMVTPRPVVMRAGLLLDYQLHWRGLPIRWQSEIKVWEPPWRFVDVQRKGPYRSWVHEHRFEQTDGGTEVTDRVDYAVPGGWITNQLLVGRDLRSVFEYRRNRLKEIFTAEPAELHTGGAQHGR